MHLRFEIPDIFFVFLRIHIGSGINLLIDFTCLLERIKRLCRFTFDFLDIDNRDISEVASFISFAADQSTKKVSRKLNRASRARGLMGWLARFA